MANAELRSELCGLDRYRTPPRFRTRRGEGSGLWVLRVGLREELRAPAGAHWERHASDDPRGGWCRPERDHESYCPVSRRRSPSRVLHMGSVRHHTHHLQRRHLASVARWARRQRTLRHHHHLRQAHTGIPVISRNCVHQTGNAMEYSVHVQGGAVHGVSRVHSREAPSSRAASRAREPEYPNVVRRLTREGARGTGPSSAGRHAGSAAGTIAVDTPLFRVRFRFRLTDVRR